VEGPVLAVGGHYTGETPAGFTRKRWYEIQEDSMWHRFSETSVRAFEVAEELSRSHGESSTTMFGLSIGSGEFLLGPAAFVKYGRRSFLNFWR
jgi:hypothetical protein